MVIDVLFRDIAFERRRTRDRLLEYDYYLIPLSPHSAGIAMLFPTESDKIVITIPAIIEEAQLNTIYPWENYSLSILSHQMYLIAKDNGFDGSESQFLTKFGAIGTATNGNVIVGTVETFPEHGDENALYLDRDTGILYYFKETENSINISAAIENNAFIKQQEENYFSLYIPIRALLIEDTILNCGDASEYIG